MIDLTRNCAGMPRRDFLQLGIGAVLGLGFSDILRLRAKAASAQASPKSAGKQVNCILVWLDGGPSHYETFDPKPEAPSEIRGEFKPIATNVPGIQVCEHLPHVAKTMDHLSLIRSFRHHNSDHGPADHFMLTGYFPTAGFNPNLNPNNQKPSHGSVIARRLGPRGSVPPYVALPKMHPSGGSAYLGAEIGRAHV